LYGYFFSSAIDTDQNGSADLGVCYDWNPSPIFVNRAQVDEEIERWHQASYGSFTTIGNCSLFAEIRFGHDDFGPCQPGNGTDAGTQDKGNVGYSSIWIYYNVQCYPHLDWYDTDGIDPGKISALAVALHEVGHALGLNHSTVANAVMNDGGPDNCSIVGNDLTLALDDANGYRARYPGIADTGTSFPPSAGCVN
jgi:hypothetical protein